MNDIQRTDQWYADKLGCVGASRVADAVRRTQKGYSTSRLNYMAEIIAERLTKQNAQIFINKDIQWGIDNEDKARAIYEVVTGNLVTQVGSMPHPFIPMAGASPDGSVGNAGGLEIKCPKSETHIKTLISGEIDPDYIIQCQWQMACTGWQWVDFVSFDPRLPRELSFWTKRVERDEKMIVDLENEVRKFLAETDLALAKMYDSSLAKKIAQDGEG